MSNDLENDTPTNESEQDTKPENETSEELVEIDGKQVTKKEAYEQQKGRAERAERELKTLKAKSEKETPKNEEKKEEKSDESTKIAYKALLNTLGYKNPDDQKYIFEEAEKLKVSPADVVNMEHAKLQLKTSKTQREAEDGMPDGGGKKGGGAKNSIEYWIDRTNKDGGYENPTDPELTIKVVNARMDREGYCRVCGRKSEAILPGYRYF